MQYYFYWPIKIQVDNNKLLLLESQHDNSASHSCCMLISQLKRKPSESCQKVVTELSQPNKKVCPSGNGTTCSTVTTGLIPCGHKSTAVKRHGQVFVLFRKILFTMNWKHKQGCITIAVECKCIPISLT